MRLNSLLRSRRLFIAVCLLSFFITVFHYSRNGSRTPLFRNGSLKTGLNNEDSFCNAFPDPGNIAIALKTGATEVVEKIPMQMQTTLRCAQDVMIFSDLDQAVAGYQVHDALARIPRSAMEGNREFEYYFKLREMGKYGQLERMLKHARVLDSEGTDLLASWVLDKYKHLHMWEMLYEAYPDKDWYVMIDADTYLVWPNFLNWTRQLPDPTATELYIGSLAEQGGVEFAHSGSGILMSQATMSNLTVVHKGMASRWDKGLLDLCCGDLMTGIVLKEIGITFKDAWPTINGEKPMTMGFAGDYWCEPVVTMHHVEPHEMNLLANFERARDNTQGPLTFADLFNKFTRHALPDSLEDWDNLCDDFEFDDVDSFETCHRRCREDPTCFQFEYNGDRCVLGCSIHLGGPSETVNGTRWHSGWIKDRIEAWVEDEVPCVTVFPWIS